MSAVEAAELLRKVNEKIDLIEPTTGKLFFEHKSELVFCRPHLMPLKTQALERLEEMHRETARQLQKKRSSQSNPRKITEPAGSQ
ncbi:BBSome-interacting protein 1 [Drosophila serrata]|uniref:BBSome-interacting protein 1 n=1 Tax=Drosophila serrata TaxID=7274 RepID=UPI000A1D1DB9|nr:BBSome-interacting protein 1 [Drosophila serrata]